MKNIQRQKGFTLVELAIVLTIVGLLIGGILKGQQLISNAKVTSQMAQIHAIDAATTTFQDTYAGIPGDLASASTRLPANACGGAACVNGDGDGAVGAALTALPTAVFAAAGTGTGENVNFFLHLAGASLISGVGGVNPAVFGSGLPNSKVTGGLGVARITTASAANVAARDGGLYILMASSPTSWANTTAGNGTLTPNQAAQIDRKMDDGIPLTGEVVASGTTANCTGATYTETAEVKDCNLQFKAQQ